MKSICHLPLLSHSGKQVTRSLQRYHDWSHLLSLAGANITHKQEERFLVAHCAYSSNNTTESEHTYQLNLNTSANGDDESEQGDIRSSRSCGTTAREDKQKGPKVYFLEIAKIDKTITTSRSRAFERD